MFDKRLNIISISDWEQFKDKYILLRNELESCNVKDIEEDKVLIDTDKLSKIINKDVDKSHNL